MKFSTISGTPRRQQRDVLCLNPARFSSRRDQSLFPLIFFPFLSTLQKQKNTPNLLAQWLALWCRSSVRPLRQVAVLSLPRAVQANTR